MRWWLMVYSGSDHHRRGRPRRALTSLNSVLAKLLEQTPTPKCFGGGGSRDKVGGQPIRCSTVAEPDKARAVNFVWPHLPVNMRWHTLLLDVHLKPEPHDNAESDRRGRT